MSTTIIAPAAIGATVPATSTQVIGANPSRVGLYVFNPSSVAIWICPAFGQQSPATPTGLPFPAVVNGAGSLVVQPGQGIMLGPPAMPEFSAALNAISASGSNPLTIWEYYP